MRRTLHVGLCLCAAVQCDTTGYTRTSDDTAGVAQWIEGRLGAGHGACAGHLASLTLDILQHAGVGADAYGLREYMENSSVDPPPHAVSFLIGAVLSAYGLHSPDGAPLCDAGALTRLYAACATAGALQLRHPATGLALMDDGALASPALPAEVHVHSIGALLGVPRGSLRASGMYAINVIKWHAARAKSDPSHPPDVVTQLARLQGAGMFTPQVADYAIRSALGLGSDYANSTEFEHLVRAVVADAADSSMCLVMAAPPSATLAPALRRLYVPDAGSPQWASRTRVQADLHAARAAAGLLAEPRSLAEDVRALAQCGGRDTTETIGALLGVRFVAHQTAAEAALAAIADMDLAPGVARVLDCVIASGQDVLVTIQVGGLSKAARTTLGAELTRYVKQGYVYAGPAVSSRLFRHVEALHRRETAQSEARRRSEA